MTRREGSGNRTKILLLTSLTLYRSSKPAHMCMWFCESVVCTGSCCCVVVRTCTALLGEALKAQEVICLLSLGGCADSQNKCVANGSPAIHRPNSTAARRNWRRRPHSSYKLRSRCSGDREAKTATTKTTRNTKHESQTKSKPNILSTGDK